MSPAAYAQDRMDHESVTAFRMGYARESRKRIVKGTLRTQAAASAELRGCSSKGPDFLFPHTDRCGHDTEAEGQRKPGGDFASGRDLLSMTDYRVTHLITGLGVVMGIIAWIVLGLAAGLIANMLIPGRRQQGLILTCVIGIVGALGGGWAATKIFHIHSLQGFFNLSTWLTAIAGAAVLLLVYHLVTGRAGRSSGRRRFAHR
jgi:uncharacterized membrane protein YeaQ/YmgE (transglycosylase-associated protein family)